MCKPSGFLSLDGFRALNFSFSWNAVKASLAGLGRTVRIEVCGTAVDGVLDVGVFVGSYRAELNSNGGSSDRPFACCLFSVGTELLRRSFSFSRSEPELSGVGSLLGTGKGGIVTSTGVSPIEGSRWR